MTQNILYFTTFFTSLKKKKKKDKKKIGGVKWPREVYSWEKCFVLLWIISITLASMHTLLALFISSPFPFLGGKDIGISGPAG